ncbi:hypothetical protein DAPPUDRAFT_122434 [Daphnia pulex]|uniref:Uncharacterized protein n=1 Tax=Daphnia pulex TaxID=6669 RepID=E9I468_DAPPU|nr:hypothetical protein DAPPUDRAFT_122434 [Daphnia pulex]|eukprot:EFX61212.1 hypothetical protein DAPPUDRAFT_122434 [Daphnia pulex]
MVETLLPCGHLIKVPCSLRNNNNNIGGSVDCVVDGCRRLSTPLATKFDLKAEITKLLTKYLSDESLFKAAESLLRDKSVEDQWRMYQRMYYLCLSAVFKGDLERSYSYSTVNNQPAQVKLQKEWADDLRASHQAVQVKSLEQQATAQVEGCWSVQCLKDALFQWRRLDLLRQCLTMLSVEPQSDTSQTCQHLLKKAQLALQDDGRGSPDKKWTTSQENDVYALLKSVATKMEFDLTRPDVQMIMGHGEHIYRSKQPTKPLHRWECFRADYSYFDLMPFFITL